MWSLNKKLLLLVPGLCIILLLLFILVTVDKPKKPLSTEKGKALADNIFVPTIKNNILPIELSADSFISVYAGKDGKEKVLVEKNIDEELPIASITKLMTALVASEQYKPADTVTVYEKSLKVKGASGIYHVGDKFLFSEALRAMLVASHNEITSAISEIMGTETFVDLMNKKAIKLRLSDTEFVNPIGTDSDFNPDSINHSTVFDLYKLARYIKENRPDILSITTAKEFDLFNTDKDFIGKIKNTDKLLDSEDLPFKIIGGKTGETPRAKKNLVTVSEAPCGGTIYSVVLHSDDNFGDMEKLLHYIVNSYEWMCYN